MVDFSQELHTGKLTAGHPKTIIFRIQPLVFRSDADLVLSRILLISKGNYPPKNQHIP